MQKRKQRRSDRAGRPAMRSPGRPPVAGREEQRRFWKAIALGRSSEDAAVSCGVSPPVGGRWFREGGGMPPISVAPRLACYLSFAEREEIAILSAQGTGVRDIAGRLRRAPSTVSRELRRNAATRSGGLEYRAATAQWHSDRRARRPKTAKLAANDRLRIYVQDRLAGTVMAEDGTPVPGPRVGSWGGRRHGRRQDRHWATAWSPQQIAHRLRIEYPDDASMRISHEAIYHALYIQGRGGTAPRADRMPAHRAGVARTEGPPPWSRQGVCRPRDHDQRAARRGRGPSGSWTLGRRPDHRTWQLRDRHSGRTHHPIHDAAPPAPHGRTWPTQGQERSGACRAWRRSRTGCDHCDDRDAP